MVCADVRSPVRVCRPAIRALWTPMFVPAFAVLISGAAAQTRLLPEPPPLPFEQRETPYSVVLLGLPDGEAELRDLLATVREMGATKTQTLVYRWKLETLGGDYWKEMGYPPSHVGDNAQHMLDAYVRISGEFGLRPCLRLGTFRVFRGKYHPMDPDGSPDAQAHWLEALARRYRGRIDHYVLGDEENKGFDWGWSGSPQDYVQKVFISLAAAIKRGDPDARVSATSVSSAPATDWTLAIVEGGVAEHGDGVAGNYSDKRIEDLTEITDLMSRVRRVWPRARFYANGVGYADHRGLDDKHQAGIVAQCMFTLWDIGWDSAPYYTYTFSRTADTHQDFGLMSPPTRDAPARYSAAWKAYQTIAQTFYDHSKLRVPDFPVSIRQSEVLTTADGTSIRLAPPEPVMRAFIREQNQLLLYLAYRRFREPRAGRWDLVLDTMEWGGPQRIPLLDYRGRVDLPHHMEDGRLIVADLPVGLEPVIVTLRRIAPE